MKKEFKTPEIYVKALDALDGIMASEGVLGGAKSFANTNAMYKYASDAEIAAQYDVWKAY